LGWCIFYDIYGGLGVFQKNLNYEMYFSNVIL
jgi:hypothetical protein